MKLLALGDSYTIGEGVPLEASWPYQLQRELNTSVNPISSVKIIAKTGWRTDELIEAINEAQLNGKFDFVSLLIGVNNQYQKKPINQYYEEFPTLLSVAISQCKSNTLGCFVISIPDYAYTPFGKKSKQTSQEIDEYNRFAKEECKRHKVEFIDIHKASREAWDKPDLLADDKLHPSEKMYKQWVAKILQSPIFTKI